MDNMTIAIFTELFFTENYKLIDENEFMIRYNDSGWIHSFVGIVKVSDSDISPLFFSDIEYLVSRIYNDLNNGLKLKYKHCFWWYDFTFDVTDDGIDIDDYVVSCDDMPYHYRTCDYENLSYIIDISPNGLFEFDKGWVSIVGDKAIGKSIIRHLAIKNKKNESTELPYDDSEDVPF